MAAGKLDICPPSSAGLSPSPCNSPSHAHVPRAQTHCTCESTRPTPNPHTSVYPLKDHTGHTGPQFMKTTSTRLTQTLHKGTHCPQTFHGDMLESHIVTTHRYAHAPKSDSSVTPHRQHMAQTDTLSIPDVHPGDTYTYLSRANAGHKRTTHTAHQHTSYPVITAKT